MQNDLNNKSNFLNEIVRKKLKFWVEKQLHWFHLFHFLELIPLWSIIDRDISQNDTCMFNAESQFSWLKFSKIIKF